MLMEMNRPAEAMVQFDKTLERTPNRPKAIFGIARAAEALGDDATATARYTEFLELWKNADEDRRRNWSMHGSSCHGSRRQRTDV